jgi:hypothetical protein
MAIRRTPEEVFPSIKLIERSINIHYESICTASFQIHSPA